MKRFVRGFTLNEILVSIALFSLLVIPVIKLLNFSTKGNAKTKKTIVAISLASVKMEQYKYMGFTALKKELDIKRESGNNFWEFWEMSPVDGYAGYRRFVRISYFPDPNPPVADFTDPSSLEKWQRIQISVEVFWQDLPNTPERSMKLFSIISNKKVFGLP